jgi:hypothetical protein
MPRQSGCEFSRVIGNESVLRGAKLSFAKNLRFVYWGENDDWIALFSARISGNDFFDLALEFRF